MTFDGIIFDVDGTIWNTTPVVAEAWNIVIDKHFPKVPHVTADILKGQFGKTMDVIADNLFPMLAKDQKDLLMSFCCEQEQIALENNSKDLTYEGLFDGVKKLSEKYPLFIVSNCQSGYIEIVVEKTGIKPYIKDFECFGDTGKEKWDNIKLLVTRNNLNNPVYIGDTNGDYEACKEAGVPFIWAAYGFGKPEDDKYFAKADSISDLVNIL